MKNENKTLEELKDELEDLKVLGTGDKSTRFLSSVSIPKVVVKNISEISSDEKGYYHLGFIDINNKKNYDNDSSFKGFASVGGSL